MCVFFFAGGGGGGWSSRVEGLQIWASLCRPYVGVCAFGSLPSGAVLIQANVTYSYLNPPKPTFL